MSVASAVTLLAALLLVGAPPLASQAPLAAKDLPRGAVLGVPDIRYDDAPADAQPTAESAVGPGWVTRRVIAAGEPLREPAVGRPPLVRAGEVVELIWSAGTIELRLRGTAMGAATEGQRVIVRIDSRRRMEGVAVAAGQVRINGESR